MSSDRSPFTSWGHDRGWSRCVSRSEDRAADLGLWFRQDQRDQGPGGFLPGDPPECMGQQEPQGPSSWPSTLTSGSIASLLDLHQLVLGLPATVRGALRSPAAGA